MNPIRPHCNESLELSDRAEDCAKDGGDILAEEKGPEDEDDVAELFGDFDDEGKDDKKDVEPIEIEGDAETNQARAIRQPGQPSRKEIEEHNLTHADFRDWCE